MWTALGCVGLVIGVGAWLSRQSDNQRVREADRRRLLARREKLFADLVRLERDRGAGMVETRYQSRRESLVTALEQIYGALDDEDHGPEPAERAA
jgi:hypothetical protein